MRKGIQIIALILLCTMLSGCSIIGLDAQSLMHTPRPTGEKAGIHAALEEQAGEGFSLRYPARGDYRYAVITRDVDHDGNDEAIAFYRKKGESAGTNVMFIEKDGTKWHAVGSFNNAANTVDEVFFGDVNKDGTEEVIIGWGSSQNNATSISVYSLKGGTVSETKLEQSYTEMAVNDFDGDGAAELFTANLAFADQPAAARLMRLKENGAEVIGTVMLDSGVTKYLAISSGYINEQQKGVVLDGQKNANTVVTELLYWSSANKKLESPLYDPVVQTENITKRSTSALAKDINNDKIIEIPIMTLLPGYTPAKAGETDYMTNWYRYDTANSTLVQVQSVIMDYTDGYWFLIPDTRRGKITAEMNVETRTLTFYEWLQEGASGKRGAAILRVRRFSEAYWNPAKYPQYQKILENNNVVYAAELPVPENPLALSLDDVKDSFQLISQD